MSGAALRILLCTHGGLHGAVVARRLLATPRVQLAGVVRSTRALHPDQGFVAAAAEYVRRSGLAYAGYLWSATSLADVLLRFAAPGTVAAQARAAGAPVHDTARINDPRSLAFISACKPDLLVSAFFNQRIGDEAARLPRLGAVNIHPSPLPELRGVDPVFYVHLRGLPAAGVTVHRITSELDAGPLLRQERIALAPGESVLRATARLYERGAALLGEALGEIEAGAPGTPQGPGGSYDSWPARADVSALGRRGVALVKASDLWPGGRIVESGRTAAR